MEVNDFAREALEGILNRGKEVIICSVFKVRLAIKLRNIFPDRIFKVARTSMEMKK